MCDLVVVGRGGGGGVGRLSVACCFKMLCLLAELLGGNWGVGDPKA